MIYNTSHDQTCQILRVRSFCHNFLIWTTVRSLHFAFGTISWLQCTRHLDSGERSVSYTFFSIAKYYILEPVCNFTDSLRVIMLT